MTVTWCSFTLETFKLPNQFLSIKFLIMKKYLFIGIVVGAICFAFSSCEKAIQEPINDRAVPDLSSVSAVKTHPGVFAGDIEDENDFTCIPGGALCYVIVTPSIVIADPIPGYSSYVPAPGYSTIEVEAYLDGPTAAATLFEFSEIKINATGPTTTYRAIGVE